ncbi:Cytochrome [Abeliophyllum distichum]|uniref:Cytochrome n=1 Tax=Abeliophyllum distichum TaxID=126358 RepID=A0ABD1Q3X4_9LAMI
MFKTLMEFGSWFPVVLFLIFVLSLLFQMKPKIEELSNLPPSPPILPIIGNLHQLGKIPHHSLWKLAQKYGLVMLLQLGQVPNLVVSSAEMAKQVLRTHDLECCSKPYSYGTMKILYNLLDVAFGPYSEYWRELRKICVIELFTIKRVQSFWNIREKEHCFRKSYGEKQFEGYFKFQEAIDEAMAMLSSFWAADFFPNLGWILDVIIGLDRRLESCFEDFDAFFEGLIDEHLDPERPRPEHKDIIDVLLEVSNDETAPIHLSKDHVF